MATREGDREWEPPERLIDAAVADAFRRYRVVGFYADPALWQGRGRDVGAGLRPPSEVRASGQQPLSYHMNRTTMVARALAAFEEAIVNGDLSHDGSYRLTEHAERPARPGARDFRVGKAYPDSPHKIDAAIAAVLAWHARLDAVAHGIARRAGRSERRAIVL